MPQIAPSEESDYNRIALGLLESVGRDGSQRKLASDLGIAIVRVDACLKRYVKKDSLRITHGASQQFASHLTLRHFAEKSNRAANYLSYSLSSFRQAKSACAAARAPGYWRVLLAAFPTPNLLGPNITKLAKAN